MKILDESVAQDIEIVVQQKQQQEYKKVGEHQLSIDGGTIFQYNRITRQFTKAKFRESDTYVFGGDNRKKIDIEKDCIYIEALNEKNALKRLKRGDFIHAS